MRMQAGACNTWILLMAYHAVTWSAYILTGKMRRAPIETPNPSLQLQRAGTATTLVLSLMLLVSTVIPFTRGAQLAGGLILYGAGLCISLVAIFSFMRSPDGLNMSGIFRFSRNPMYTGSFLSLAGTCFSGFRLDLSNIVFMALLCAWGVAIHRTVKLEEALLSSIHGEAFEQYRAGVPRYLML